jgi:membrane protease YdiL (CAAX protease family)
VIVVSRLDYALAATGSPERTRHQIAILIPAAVPVTMIGVFAASNSVFGPLPGYLIGFLVYWGVWCLVVPVMLLGPTRVRQLWADRRPRLGRPGWLGLLLLLFPPLGALATRWLPEVGGASLAMIGGALVIGFVNATMEELLWRGVFVSLWPEDWRLGLLWPTVGFAAWHFAPQIIHPAALGAFPYVLASGILGLCWGWVAWRTGSVRWSWLSHIVTDSSGVRNVLFFLPA